MPTTDFKPLWALLWEYSFVLILSKVQVRATKHAVQRMTFLLRCKARMTVRAARRSGEVLQESPMRGDSIYISDLALLLQIVSCATSFKSYNRHRVFRISTQWQNPRKRRTRVYGKLPKVWVFPNIGFRDIFYAIFTAMSIQLNH